VAASSDCEKAIRGLVSPGGLIDLFVDVATKGFAGGAAELLNVFFNILLGPVAALARPLFAAFLEKLGGRGAVNSFSQKLLDFVQKARAAAQCLDQFDEAWREAAERADVDVDTLKQVVRQLSGKSEEEIRRRVEELAKSLEEAERHVRAISISPDATYFYAEDWLAGREEGGRLKLCNVFMGDCGRGIYMEYVPNELEKKVVKEVRKKAAEGGGLVVVRGAKGIGKSTAVQVALYRVLQLPLKVGDQYYKPVVVVVDDYDKDVSERFIHVARGLGFYPIFYLDPSKPRAYPKEPTGLYQPEMSIEEVRSVLDKLRDVTGAVAVVVLSNDQHQAVEGLVSGAKVIDADQLLAPRNEERRKFVEALVEKYSGCIGDAVESVINAIASFDDNYAVAAVLAANWLGRSGCDVKEVEKIVESAEGDIHRFILHYLWYGLFRGEGAVANRYAPLLLAVGLFGPHPPKLAKAVVRAFGGEPDEAVVRWFSQPLHGTLYEAIRKVAHGAVYRRFGIGSDELCQGSVEGPCLLVEICSETLAGVPRKRYSGVVEVAWEYVKLVAERLKAPGPAGVRQINFLIDDFLQAYNGEDKDGHWKISYEVMGPEGVKVFEDIVDELDVLSALYGLATLPVWIPQPLEDWFIVGGKKVKVIRLYLFPLLREKGGELVKRAVAFAHEIGMRGFYTAVDALRALGIASAGQWDSATNEDLEKAVRLATYTLNTYATAWPIVLRDVESLLSETWRRVVSRETREDGERRQRLANWLTAVVYSAARGHPPSLLYFFVAVVDEPDLNAAPRRFDTLYNAASSAGKRLLIDALFYALGWDIGGVVAVLLGIPPLKAFVEVARRVEELVSQLDGIEKAYVVASLYPRLARQYTYFNEFDKAVKLVGEVIKALEELWSAYEKNKASTEERLRPYLELRVKPDLKEELNELSQLVYYNVVHVYIVSDELDKAVEYAEKACNLAKKLGYVYYEVLSCNLPLRLKVVRDGAPSIKELEDKWQRALQAVGELGTVAIAFTLGEYVVALASAGRLSDVEKVLEKWGWALELDPDVSALTHGVLSLFDERYLEGAVEGLPGLARANLPRLADALHDAVESGLFVKEPEIVKSATRTLTLVYGEDVIKALAEVAPSSKLFLSVLVGLAYCKRGGEWGLKLARGAARAGSQRFEGIGGRLFGELYKALEKVDVGNCITDEVLKAVYKLYYLHV